MAATASWALGWIAAAGLCLTACSWSQTRPDAPTVDGSAPQDSSSAAASKTEASKSAAVGDLAEESPLEVADTLLIRISDVDGLSTAQAGAWLAPATETVEP